VPFPIVIGKFETSFPGGSEKYSNTYKKRRIAPPLPHSLWAAQAAPDVVVQPLVLWVPEVSSVRDPTLLQQMGQVLLAVLHVGIDQVVHVKGGHDLLHSRGLQLL